MINNLVKKIYRKLVYHIWHRQTALSSQFLPRDAMHKRGICRHPVSVFCLSVRLSVCHVRELRQNEYRYLQKFFIIGSQDILVFPYQTGWHYSNGNPPNGGVECKGYEKNGNRPKRPIAKTAPMKVENGPRKPKRPQWNKKTTLKRPQLTSKTVHSHVQNSPLRNIVPISNK